MTQKFKLEQPLPLETVYITKESKRWIKEQSATHNVSMVAVLDEMVNFCKANAVVKRPNVLKQGLEK